MVGKGTITNTFLNYNVPQDVPRNVPQESLDEKTIRLIQNDNKISTKKMSIILGVSSKTIKRHIKEMPRVVYIGRGANGHWEIIDSPK